MRISGVPWKRAAIAFSALAGVLSQVAVAQAADCDTLPSPIIVKGSSAVKPFATAIGSALAGTTTVVYVSGGSCTGVDAALNDTPVTTDGTYWDGDGNPETCTMPSGGLLADIGVSDVFPTSCAGFEDANIDDLGVGDFQGPIQIMTFIVPVASSRRSISAEAAYLTFGLGADGDSPWSDESLMFVRNAGSGTQSMIGKAINVRPDAFKGTDSGGSQGVLTGVGNSSDADATIGILSTGETDTARDSVRILAYQHYGQSCGYWPDSSVTSFDKMNVRIGRYPIWGPLHMLTKVNSSGDPRSEAAADLIGYVSGTKLLSDVNIVDLEIGANLVPQCAMQVTRTSELGALASFQPTNACGCYFDSLKGDDGAPSSCDSCNTDDDCSGSTPKCSYGYCEAQ